MMIVSQPLGRSDDARLQFCVGWERSQSPPSGLTGPCSGSRETAFAFKVGERNGGLAITVGHGDGVAVRGILALGNRRADLGENLAVFFGRELLKFADKFRRGDGG